MCRKFDFFSSVTHNNSKQTRAKKKLETNMQRSSSITSTSATSTTITSSSSSWRRARQQQHHHRRNHHHQKVHSSANNNDNDGVGDIVKVVLKVPDMMCEGCAESVTNALKESSTTREISIDLETKLVTVSVGGCASAVEAMGKIPELVGALKENGFDAEPVFD